MLKYKTIKTVEFIRGFYPLDGVGEVDICVVTKGLIAPESKLNEE